jgi:hemin uptake protein HemP
MTFHSTNKVARGDTPTITPDDPTRYLDSAILFRNADTIRIQHNGMTYTLRRTRLGKLLLTK